LALVMVLLAVNVSQRGDIDRLKAALSHTDKGRAAKRYERQCMIYLSELQMLNRSVARFSKHNKALREKVKKYEARLEVFAQYRETENGPLKRMRLSEDNDGIACRDATIDNLTDMNNTLRESLVNEQRRYDELREQSVKTETTLKAGQISIACIDRVPDVRQGAPAHELEELLTAEDVKAWIQSLESQQARIDALMLEFCPDEMTEEQKTNWAAAQEPVELTVEERDELHKAIM
jgi:predicted RNase H-like nuclease (RuvC/YqgF family)